MKADQLVIGASLQVGLVMGMGYGAEEEKSMAPVPLFHETAVVH